MLNISDTDKAIWAGDSVNKQMIISIPDRNITLTNDDIESEKAELSEVIENETSLTFKGCKASSFIFSCANIVTDLRGEYIEVTIQATGTQAIPLFSGYIDNQTNLTHQDRTTEFKAYDPLYKVDGIDVTAWLNGLTYPITVKNFRNSFFNQINITQETVNLPADSLSISANIKTSVSSITAGQVMRWICQVNGRYGQYGRDGYFHYRKLRQIMAGLYPSTETYPSDHTYPAEENADILLRSGNSYISIEYEPYEVAVIDKIAIYDNAGIDQGQYGSGTNAYCVQDNPIAYNVNMSSLAQILYSEISNCALYIPVDELKTPGFPWIECGDIILVNTSRNVVRTYVLERTLKGVQALFDSFLSNIDEFQPPYKQTAETRISANGQNILKIQADIVEMNTLIADRATIAQLNATNARVGSLEADHVSVSSFNALNGRVGSLEADHVSVASLNATNAAINNLSAIAITTQNLSAQHISANQISGGTLSGNYIRGGTISGVTLSNGGNWSVSDRGYMVYGGSECVWGGADVMFADGTTGHINFMTHR